MAPRSLFIFVAAFVAGCAGCPTGSNRTGRGEVSYVVEAGGVQQIASEGLYEFPPTPMGTSEPPTLKVIVRNTGIVAFTVVAFEKTSGDAIRLGAEPTSDSVFTLDYEKGVEVRSGDSREFLVTYTPPLVPNQTVIDHEVKLTLTAANTTAETEKTNLTIRGRAIAGECDLPSEIDFGVVNVSQRVSRSISFQNTGVTQIEARAGAPSVSDGDAVFSYKADSARGDFTIAPNKTTLVNVEFTPTQSRDYFSTVQMRRAKGCPNKTVRLKGTGVTACLSWRCDPTDDPNASQVDLGYLPVGSTTEGRVTFSNACTFPIDLTNLTVSEATFRVTQANPNDLTKLTVPAATRGPGDTVVAGMALTKIAFRPTALGNRSGTLQGTTTLVNQPAITVTLKGAGGGPNIDVRPSPLLNFGVIGYFPGASPAAFAQRRLTIVNVGTRPIPADPRANLRLGLRNVAPYWSVRAISGSASELCVGTWNATLQTCSNDLPLTGPGSYDPNIGLEASGASAFLDIPVRVIPQSLGAKEFELTIYSNDADEPARVLTIRADAQTLPPCNFDVSPAVLNFGVVTPPSTRDLSFKIRNRGTEACTVSGVDMDIGSDELFVLPNPIADHFQIAPGQEETVVVRAWPQRPLGPNVVQAVGKVVFNISSPTQPFPSVALNATLAPSCLTVSPSDLNFGTVQTGCRSPDKTFTVYNTCSQPLTINSTRMSSPSLVPQGTGACAAVNGCNEFDVAMVPANFLGQLASGASKTFSLRYNPYDLGADVGAFAINVTQTGTSVGIDYLVSLKGAGDAAGQNEDVYRQDAKPKADILFVVDNSCSMGDKQQYLGVNFTAFLRYAVANQVDFQIGVTTTDDDVGGEQGRLVPSPAGLKIFKPTTLNLEQQFAAAVNVGINGSGDEKCLSPATKALTAPLITDPANNAGFVRPDAVLAVVCVTDELEHSVNPVPFYLNQLFNVKGAQRASMFTFNAIGPFVQNAPCLNPGDFDAPSVGRYSLAIAATGGVKENICTPNWAPALENLGRTAFGFRTSFFLTARPADPADIHVFVDGMPKDRTGTHGLIWEYDPITNAIVFQPLYVPEPGQSMSIRYQVACNP